MFLICSYSSQKFCVVYIHFADYQMTHIDLINILIYEN